MQCVIFTDLSRVDDTKRFYTLLYTHVVIRRLEEFRGVSRYIKRDILEFEKLNTQLT